MTVSKNTRKKTRNNKTPASVLIEAHYKLIKVNEVWDRNRVQRLLGYLRLSERELVAMLNTTTSSFKSCYLRGSVTGPCALMLSVLESTYLSEFITDSLDNLFDFYGTSRHS